MEGKKLSEKGIFIDELGIIDALMIAQVNAKCTPKIPLENLANYFERKSESESESDSYSKPDGSTYSKSSSSASSKKKEDEEIFGVDDLWKDL